MIIEKTYKLSIKDTAYFLTEEEVTKLYEQCRKALNISATQELHKKLEIQEKRIQELDKLLEEEDRKLREQEEKIEFLLNNFF